MKQHEMYIAYFYYGTLAVIALAVIVAVICLINMLIKRRKMFEYETTMKELEIQIKFGRKVYFSKDKRYALVARYYSSVWWNPFDWYKVKIKDETKEEAEQKLKGGADNGKVY